MPAEASLAWTGNGGSGPFLIASGRDSLLGLGRVTGGLGDALDRAGSTLREGFSVETSGKAVNMSMLCGEAGAGLKDTRNAVTDST